MLEVYEGNLYLAWGYENYREYVEQELGFDVRKGQMLVQLQKWFATLPKNVVDWVQSLGWGKAILLLRVVTPENAKEWKRKTEGLSLRQIEEIINEAKHIGDEESDGGDVGGEQMETTTRISTALFPEQQKIVTDAFELAKSMADNDKVNFLLELICTDFLAANASTQTNEDYLKSVERVTGLKIVAINSDDEVVYNEELLEAYA